MSILAFLMDRGQQHSFCRMEKLWNRNYLKVMTANFALFFAFYLLTPLLPIYLNEYFSASKDMIVVVLSGVAAVNSNSITTMANNFFI